MVLIPSFAVGRAQTLLWALHTLMQTHRVPRVPIVVDSPMATKATEALTQNPQGLRLSSQDLHDMCAPVQFVASVPESKALNLRTEPFILIAASGMLTGGRVLHHLERRAPKKLNTLLFVGFQAPGTRGARLVAGETPVKVYGRKIDVLCEVVEIGGFSAHADSNELCAWLASAPTRPGRVFLNHGEPGAVDALRLRLKEDGYRVTVASEGVAWDLDDLTPSSMVQPVDAPVEDLMSHVTGLQFSEEADFAKLLAALESMENGEIPVVPIEVQGAALLALARGLRKS